MFLKGFSGISIGVLKQLLDAFNASCLSWVPGKILKLEFRTSKLHFHVHLVPEIC